jgi:hypothetical protein
MARQAVAQPAGKTLQKPAIKPITKPLAVPVTQRPNVAPIAPDLKPQVMTPYREAPADPNVAPQAPKPGLINQQVSAATVKPTGNVYQSGAVPNDLYTGWAGPDPGVTGPSDPIEDQPGFQTNPPGNEDGPNTPPPAQPPATTGPAVERVTGGAKTNARLTGTAHAAATQTTGPANTANVTTTGEARQGTLSQSDPAVRAEAERMDAVTRGVNENETSAYHLNKITSQDSANMQRAAAQGRMAANRRGLINSSIAAGMAQGAMVDRATPLAVNDAKTYAGTASDNMGARNTANQTNANLGTQANLSNARAEDQVNMFNTGEANRMSQFNASENNAQDRFNVGETNRVNMFNAGEQNTTDRFNTSEANATSRFNTGEANRNDQFNAAEANKVSMFNTGQENDNYRFNADSQNRANLTEYTADRDSAEKALDRQNRLDLVDTETNSKYETLPLDIKANTDKAISMAMAGGGTTEQIKAVVETLMKSANDTLTAWETAQGIDLSGYKYSSSTSGGGYAAPGDSGGDMFPLTKPPGVDQDVWDGLDENARRAIIESGRWG